MEVGWRRKPSEHWTASLHIGLRKSSRYAEQDQYSQVRCGDRAPPRTSKACAPDTRTEYFPKIRFQYCAEFGRVPARLQKRSYPSMPELLPNTPVASPWAPSPPRSEEHTSELQSLMRISYAVCCLKKTITTKQQTTHNNSKNT